MCKDTGDRIKLISGWFSCVHIGIFLSEQIPKQLDPLLALASDALASRADGTWMATFGVAVLTLALQNDRADGSGTTN